MSPSSQTVTVSAENKPREKRDRERLQTKHHAITTFDVENLKEKEIEKYSIFSCEEESQEGHNREAYRKQRSVADSEAEEWRVG